MAVSLRQGSGVSGLEINVQDWDPYASCLRSVVLVRLFGAFDVAVRDLRFLQVRLN